MRSRKCWAFRLAPSTANGGWRAPGFTRRCTDDPRAVATHQVSVRAGARPSRGRSVALTRGDSRLAIAIAVVRQSLSPFDLHLICLRLTRYTRFRGPGAVTALRAACTGWGLVLCSVEVVIGGVRYQYLAADVG